MAKITKVKININGKDIEMSIDEAKELQDVLNKTFPVNNNLVINPVVIERVREYPYRYWDVTYSSNTMLCMSNNQRQPEFID